MKTARILPALLLGILCAQAETTPSSSSELLKALREIGKDRNGAFVLIDCASGDVLSNKPEACEEKLSPCSTFKIWNTLIGLETGILTTADAPFYKWDHVTRSITDWNRDLTLREAFKVSCVPAYQELARKIGPVRMKNWIDKLDYGDRNISSGIDVFWLSSPGRKALLISPNQQAQLIRKLVNGQLPFSEKSRAMLKDIMTAKKTARGTLYGKTGTDTDAQGVYNMGWFVGYVESGNRTLAFACLLKGEKLMGKDARAVVENFLTRLNYL